MIKVNVIERTDKTTYPKLMKSKVTGTIVLLHEARKGCVVFVGKNSLMKLGDYYTDWTMSSLVDFQGIITLGA